jgi:hypothetical protein
MSDELLCPYCGQASLPGRITCGREECVEALHQAEVSFLASKEDKQCSPLSPPSVLPRFWIAVPVRSAGLPSSGVFRELRSLSMTTPRRLGYSTRRSLRCCHLSGRLGGRGMMTEREVLTRLWARAAADEPRYTSPELHSDEARWVWTFVPKTMIHDPSTDS